MNETYLMNLLQMRILVSCLGERVHCSWWPTSFYDPAGRTFLDPIFSKTSHLAQYHGALEAARRLHDEHLSVGTYHLFRLPEEIEQDLHAALQSDRGLEIARRIPRNKDAAIDALKQLAGAGSSSSAGPISVGGINDLHTTDTLKAIAVAYLSAFIQNVKTYPYLVG